MGLAACLLQTLSLQVVLDCLFLQQSVFNNSSKALEKVTYDLTIQSYNCHTIPLSYTIAIWALGNWFAFTIVAICNLSSRLLTSEVN